MSRESRPIRYRCLDRDCGHEFDAGPGPVLSQTRHELPGTGHPATVPGACPACGGLYVGELRWFAIMTAARAEAAVADRLKALGYSRLFLHYLVTVKRTNRVTLKKRHGEEAEAEKVKRPFMPRYLFVGVVPEQSLKAVADLPGVAGFLRNERGYQQVSQVIIDRLREDAGPDGLLKAVDGADPERERLEPGAWVRFVRGGMTGLEGEVDQDSGELVGVAMDFMGGRRLIWTPPGDLLVLARAA